MLQPNIETFLACDAAYEDAKLVLFGAPFDSTTSYRPGTRFGPSAIRHESFGIETYSPYQDLDLEDYSIFDSGDLELSFGNSELALADIEARTSIILEDGKLPLMIGGDLPKNDEFTLKLLTNAPLLAIEKESWCAHPLTTTEEESLWIAPRKDGKGCYVAAFNLSDRTRTVSVPDGAVEPGFVSGTELWTGKKVKSALKARLAAHDAAVWALTF